jgi:hypothetical protein
MVISSQSMAAGSPLRQGRLPKKEIGIQKNKKTPFGLKVSVI